MSLTSNFFYIHKTKQKFGVDYLAKVNFPEKAVVSLIKRRKQINIPSITEINECNIHDYKFPDFWFSSGDITLDWDKLTCRHTIMLSWVITISLSHLLDTALADLTYNR